MTIFTTKEKTRALVAELRKRGHSYSEIQQRVSVPRSTLASWIRGIKLTAFQREQILKRKLVGARRGAQKRKKLQRELSERIKRVSQVQLKHISKRELWLMGIVLYMKELQGAASKNKSAQGVALSSSDPFQIQLFLRWLQSVGKIHADEILCDLFLKKISPSIPGHSTHNAENHHDLEKRYWSRVTHFPLSAFSRVYYFKQAATSKTRKVRSKSPYGILRLRVRASSMLARQITGWVAGLRKTLIKGE